MARGARILAALGLAVVLLYLVGSGIIVQRMAAGLLTVGPLAAALAEEPPPDDPLALGYRGDPGTALGLEFDAVRIETELGAAEGWFVPASGEGSRLGAIYVHGIAGAREDGYRHLSLLHAAGYDVLLMSYRNDPGAPADPAGTYGFGLSEWPDLEAAVGWMGERGHPDLLVVAESMGGAILGQFLRQSPRAAAVEAVALDSPAVDSRAVLAHLSGRIGVPLPAVAARAGLVVMAVAGPRPLHRARVTEVFAGFDGPLFIAHGAGDSIVPLGSTERLLAAREGPTVSVIGAAEHLQTHAEDPVRYGEAFGRFLDMAD
ncbi:alpha/beta hydrolase [Histidinibacterium lentulum]|uniref:Alpha/beta fold hydrolase n=1 Tax=Histidinibacterium lentulum TaxID=2480588 RepID=A0A3N2QVZ2_9RHOB|nr:hypothetical protein [Histidinibacterium lentulum]ROT99411.1 hypothetical protein EAT49_14425 [Histidinibacterium lentulum]